jgi:hypothetical protein
MKYVPEKYVAENIHVWTTIIVVNHASLSRGFVTIITGSFGYLFGSEANQCNYFELGFDFNIAKYLPPTPATQARNSKHPCPPCAYKCTYIDNAQPATDATLQLAAPSN